MGSRKSSVNVVSMPITPARLSEMIKARAKNRNNVKLKEHAIERQDHRSSIVEITMHDVYRVLDMGSIESVEPGKKPGEWKAVMGFRPKGERKLCLVTVVSDGTDKLFIVTVYWRDTL